eukprot:TRINITY_DN21721_c0_g1_i1.p1 TRINITY_DN21721_c0_g1~~TRINITY_DN21721_c0_g1_i1.p1  ORF type:complete len:536 (+),score=73.73 TRINITY_DN21721_c0_g1_i1:73-1680(+)
MSSTSLLDELENELLMSNDEGGKSKSNADMSDSSRGRRNLDEVDISLDEKYTPESEQSEGLKLILSHACTRFGDKMWAFVIPLILIDIFSKTLTPTALLGFFTTLVNVLFSTTIGYWIDRTDRLFVVFMGTVFQAISIAGLSVTLLFFFVALPSEHSESNVFFSFWSSLLFFFLILLSCINALAATVMNISVEKDWVPVCISNQGYLATVNSRMRQVDLVSEVVGPLLTGILLSVLGNIPGFMTVATINFISFFPQFFLLYNVYKGNKDLAYPKCEPRGDSLALNAEIEDPLNIENPSSAVASFDQLDTARVGFFWNEWNPIANLIKGWREYSQQQVMFASLAFAALWVTLLSPHDPVLTSFLRSDQYSDFWLGVFRATGAVVGILGAFAFPYVNRLYGLQLSCLAFIYIEGVFVVLAAFVFQISVMASNEVVHVMTRTLFLTFVVLSRPGLYGFEVGQIQILQNGIPEDKRGIVNSVETSLCNLAMLLVYVLSAVIYNPHWFPALTWISASFVIIACILYTRWYSTALSSRAMF